jgi:hypothetical protein
VTQRSLGVDAPLEHALGDEPPETLGEHFAGDPEVALYLVEAGQAHPHVADDERRPGLPGDLERARDIDAAVATVRARGGELVGEVENYEDIYQLRYVRGPEGIIIELAEQIG